MDICIEMKWLNLFIKKVKLIIQNLPTTYTSLHLKTIIKARCCLGPQYVSAYRGQMFHCRTGGYGGIEEESPLPLTDPCDALAQHMLKMVIKSFLPLGVAAKYRSLW